MKNRRPMLSLAFLFIAFVALPVVAADSEDQFFSSDGVNIRYKTWGIGDPIVLVHGFTASIESNWVLSGVVPTLAQEFRVIALDVRGHGKSDKPHDPKAYGPNMGDDVIRLLDHLDIGQTHIAGYSMGGFITLDLVARYPERFTSATIGGAGFSDFSADPGMVELADSLEAGEGLAPLFRRLTPAGQPEPDAEQIKMINQMVLAQNDPEALAAVARSFAALGPDAATVGKISVPLLAVVGEIDPLRAAAEQLIELQPEAELHLLAGKDHMTATSDPGLVEAMRSFIIKSCNCA